MYVLFVFFFFAFPELLADFFGVFRVGVVLPTVRRTDSWARRYLAW
jgi:hypothetical protein